MISCRAVTGPTSSLMDFDMSLDDVDRLMTFYNYRNLTSSTSNSCTDEYGNTHYYPITTFYLNEMQNHYNSVVLTSTTDVLNSELSDLRTFTYQDWGVIILSLVGVMALVFFFVQIKRVIRI